MGAGAIKKILDEIDIDQMIEDLSEQAKRTQIN